MSTAPVWEVLVLVLVCVAAVQEPALAVTALRQRERLVRRQAVTVSRSISGAYEPDRAALLNFARR